MDENSSSLCSLPGRPDLYGVGIRTAFYIQWLGSLIIEYISEEHVTDMRFISVFSSASALTALIIGAAQGKLHPLDVYFLLLFSMGFFLFQIPLRVWQLLTRCQTHLDPFYLSDEVHGVFYNLMTFTMLAGNSAIGTWYYTTFLPRLDRDCWEVVFVLGKVDLENRGYVISSAIFYVGILAMIAGFVFLGSCCDAPAPPDRRIRKKHLQRLRILRMLSGLVVFTLLVLAIELPLYWNNIDNVSEFEPLAQLIPFFLSIGLFLRSWAMWVIRDRGQEQDTDDSSSTSASESTVATDIRQYYQGHDYGGEYGYGYNNWPLSPQWPPNVYYTARE